MAKWFYYWRWVWVALAASTVSARADYLIPYELRVHQRAGGYRSYSVIVSLADHYRFFFGSRDQMSAFLAGNEFSGHHPYLRFAFEWYLQYVSQSEGIYKGGARAISEGRRQHESIEDGFSSAVLLTEYRRPKEILGMLRASVPDASNRLPVERHYWDLGLGREGFPSTSTGETFESFEEVVFAASALNRLRVPLSVDLPKYRGEWPAGGKVELKNLGIPDGLFRRVFPFLYLTGRLHKMYSYDGRRLPAFISHLPDGAPISNLERSVLGRRVSTICLEATGDKLSGMYEALLGVNNWKTLNNEHTGFQEMHFMYGDLIKADLKIEATIRAMTKNYPKVWLNYDAEMARELHDCSAQYAWEG